MRVHPVGRWGMTLLELIVGLTITGLAVTAGYGVLVSVADHRTRVEEQVEAVARAAGKRRLLVHWLEGARLTVDEGVPQFRGLDAIDEDRPEDELTFLTTAPTALGTGQTVIRLYIDRDTRTPERGLTAEFSEWRSPLVERVEVEPRAVGLNVRYFSRMLGEAAWLPSWISSGVLPSGVELTLVPAEGESLPPLLQLPVVVPVGPAR